VVEKAPDAFRTISEVAEDLDLPQHVLRFWETRFQQIKPMKRGGGRRYYRPDDVDLLRGIRHLLYGEGYTIRGVQRLLKDQGIKFVQNVWRADAPQVETAVEAEEDAPPPLARPAPGKERRGEEGAHRRLFGLLPSFLSGERQFHPEPDEEESRIEPPVTSVAPLPDAIAPAGAARALSGESRAKLEATLHELRECRKLLDAAAAAQA
jgi:DNA-binding transcriptional MerR regulator